MADQPKPGESAGRGGRSLVEPFAQVGAVDLFPDQSVAALLWKEAVAN